MRDVLRLVEAFLTGLAGAPVFFPESEDEKIERFNREVFGEASDSDRRVTGEHND